jgi:fatty-acyl-CoA synthase
MTALRMWTRALDYSKRSANLVLPGLVDQLAETNGDRLALIGETDGLTYRSLAARVNRYARWAIKSGIAGKTVALLMHNCPEYVAIWLGLTRVCCKVALLNVNLRGDALTHCINVSGAGYLIGSDDLTALIDTPVEMLQWQLDDAETANCDPLMGSLPSPQDVALLIYTSGTTGLPKAAKVTHRRITEWSFWFAGMTDAKPDDRLYNCLPMYHSIGGVVAIGSMLVSGGSVVIRQRFSASHFWDDVIQTDCTIFQYIGELCRYLTLSRPNVAERNHQLRLAVGNGLQGDVWRIFQDRFVIPQILEYYAATEGVLSLYNCDGKPGSVGRVPPILEPHYAIKLIRVDQETGEPLRDVEGFCTVVDSGEPGEAIGLITEARAFDGYNDAEDSSKFIDNVFVEGDRWYRTGDLLRKDSAGFYFFVDRLGDTFRWRGENVSTTDVASVVRSCPGVLDAVVYGVRVAGTEGRAGMAAIIATEEFEFGKFAAHLKQYLPGYARPVFVRLCESLDTTGTFKLVKARLVTESHMNASDPVWVYARCADEFVPLVQGENGDRL